MSGKVVHFEIPFDDGERARTFYRDVFGWQVMSVPDLNYTMVMTGPSDPEQGPTEPGFINGGMFERSAVFPGKAPNLVIDVSSVEDALAQVEAAGGKIVTEKMAVGEMGYTGYFTDTDAPNSISGLFRPLDPERVLDSRDATRVGGDHFDGAAKTMATLRFPGLPQEMGAVIMNVTATATGGPGYVQVGPNVAPGGLTIGSHSNLNVERAGQTIPNLVITTAAQLSDGASIYTLGPAELVADIFGWFTYSNVG